jgi:hypothetical protein
VPYFYTNKNWLCNNLTKILYHDAKSYEPRKMKAEEYFGFDIEEEKNGDKPCTENKKDEIKNNNEKNNETVNEDTNNKETSRELKKDIDIAENKKDILQLKENQNIQIVTLNNNYILERNTKTYNKVVPTQIAKFNLITINDYEELEPEKLNCDKRTFLNMLKDCCILEHSLVSLLFKKSLLDPAFIRLLKFIFNCSLQFALSAMLFTDNYIDKRLTNHNKVYSI